MLVQLADMFAREGARCIRFDYTGCGDSEGSFEAMAVSSWLEDVAAAAVRLRGATRLERIHVCGVRFGAALAALYGADCQGVDRLVMWDPVTRGGDYLRELERSHRQWLRGSFARATDEDEMVQTLGFPTTEAFREEVGATDLSLVSAAPAREIMVLQGAEAADVEGLAERFTALEAAVETHALPADSLLAATMRRVVRWILR